MDSAPGGEEGVVVVFFDSAIYRSTDSTNSHVQLGDLSWENFTDVSWIFIARTCGVENMLV